MRKIAFAVLLASALASVPYSQPANASHAAAKPNPFDIFIRGGQFVFENQEGRIEIFGTRGFRLEGSVQLAAGRFDAYRRCLDGLECPPGTVLDLIAVWGGSDFGCTVKLAGKTYTCNSPGVSAEIRFAGSAVLPSFVDGPVTLTVPFSFEGRFEVERPDEPVDIRNLIGGGNVTLFLQPDTQFPSTPSWVIQRAVFDFRPLKRRV